MVSGLAGAVFVVACGGSTGFVAGAPDASLDGNGGGGNGGDSASSGDDDGSASLDDAGIDGEVITEGGSNPDLDAGDDDGGGDTLPDGGACNAITNEGTAITSTCASVAPELSGGAFVAGTYHLTSVTTYGSASFCKTGFIPVGFKETVQMTVNAGVASADTVSQLAATKERRSSETLTPGANDSSPLTAQATCPAAAATTSVKYQSTAATAKTLVTLRLPYGKDEADYTFELQ